MYKKICEKVGEKRRDVKVRERQLFIEYEALGKLQKTTSNTLK